MKTLVFPSYDVFIFDFDGTLVDSRKNIVNSFNYACLMLGLKKIPFIKIVPLIGKKSIENTFRYFYPTLLDEQITQLASLFRAYQRDNIKDEVVFFPGVVKTLKELKRRKKYLAILTTKQVEQIKFILKELAIDEMFVAVYGDGLLSVRKPDQKCVEYVLSKIKPRMSLERVVMVGDSNVDIQTAKNAGVDMIGVTYGIDGEEKMRTNGATRTVKRFLELLRFAAK